MGVPDDEQGRCATDAAVRVATVWEPSRSTLSLEVGAAR
jgi:hypothetical protein